MSELIEVGNIVSVNNSLKEYGVELTENGTVLEVFPEGDDGFDEPLAIVLFDNITMKFGNHEVTKSIKPRIKLKDLVVVAKGSVKNLRMPDIKFDVKTKHGICSDTRALAIQQMLSIREIDKISAETMEKLDNAFNGSLSGKSDFKVKFDDKKKKLKQIMRQNLKNVTSLSKSVVAYRTVNGKRIEHQMTFDKTSLKTDLKKVKRNLDLAVRNHRKDSKLMATSESIMGVPITKLGGLFDKGGQILFLQNQIPKERILVPKKPILNDDYVGIELECITNLESFKPLRESLIKAKLDRYVDVVGDGSLRDNNGNSGENYGCTEVRVLCRNKDKVDVLTRVIDVLKQHGAYVNKYCGTHVHFDMRKIDVKTAFNNLVRIQPILRNSQPEERRVDRHCKQNTSNVFDEYDSGTRYLVVNPTSYAKHKTLEIRVHEGTLDAQGLCAWIDLIYTVAKAPKLEKNFMKINTLNNVLPIPANAVSYIEERVAKYA